MTKVDRILIKFPRDVQVDLGACGRVVIRLYLGVHKGIKQNDHKGMIYTQTIFSNNIFLSFFNAFLSLYKYYTLKFDYIVTENWQGSWEKVEEFLPRFVDEIVLTYDS